MKTKYILIVAIFAAAFLLSNSVVSAKDIDVKGKGAIVNTDGTVILCPLDGDVCAVIHNNTLVDPLPGELISVNDFVNPIWPATFMHWMGPNYRGAQVMPQN